jgi:hypothetical protein
LRDGLNSLFTRIVNDCVTVLDHRGGLSSVQKEGVSP